MTVSPTAISSPIRQQLHGSTTRMLLRCSARACRASMLSCVLTVVSPVLPALASGLPTHAWRSSLQSLKLLVVRIIFLLFFFSRTAAQGSERRLKDIETQSVVALSRYLSHSVRLVLARE